MEELEKDILQDLNAKEDTEIKENLSNLEKMSKANLEKQDKKILIQFCESKNLFKDMTERAKLRLNRKELAELIKGQNSPKAKQQAQENSINEIEIYQDALMTFLSGDSSRADALAQKNVMTFISESASENGELSEKAQKVIKITKVSLSAFYLLVKFTGGFTKWKERSINIFEKIKNKIKKKNDV